MRPSMSRCFQSRTLCPLNTTSDPVSLIVWFLKGTHPRLKLSSPAELGLPRPSATIDVSVTHFLDHLAPGSRSALKPRGWMPEVPLFRANAGHA